MLLTAKQVTGKKGGQIPPYEEWTKEELYETTKEIGLKRTSQLRTQVALSGELLIQLHLHVKVLALLIYILSLSFIVSFFYGLSPKEKNYNHYSRQNNKNHQVTGLA